MPYHFQPLYGQTALRSLPKPLYYGLDSLRWPAKLLMPYIPSAAVWGTVAVIGAMYLTAPYELMTKLPIIGGYYVEEKREEKKALKAAAEKADKEAAAKNN